MFETVVKCDICYTSDEKRHIRQDHYERHNRWEDGIMWWGTVKDLQTGANTKEMMNYKWKLKKCVIFWKHDSLRWYEHVEWMEEYKW